MNSRLARVALLALVGVLAVAAVAATLPAAQPVPSGGGGSGQGGGDGPGRGQGSGPGGGIALPAWVERAATALGGLLAIAVALALLAVVVSALYSLLRDPRALFDALSRLPTILAALLAFFGVLALAVLLIRLLPDLGGASAGGSPFGGFPSRGGGSAGEAASPFGLDALVVLALASLAALAVVWLRRRRSRRVEGEPDAEESTTAAVSRAAGRAADELDAVDDRASVENAVYGAWREMTDLLDVGARGRHTPGEFARAAVDAGFDPVAVRELTRVFEDVRYGGAAPSPDRRERAVAALRRIETGAGRGDGGETDDDVSAGDDGSGPT